MADNIKVFNYPLRHSLKQPQTQETELPLVEGTFTNEFHDIKVSTEYEECGPPSFLREILDEQKQTNLISEEHSNMIMKLRKEKEKRIYATLNDSNKAYFSEVFESSTGNVTELEPQLQSILAKKTDQIMSDIENGNLIINHDRVVRTKKHLEELMKDHTRRMISINEGQIRTKIELMNSKMDEFERGKGDPQENIEELTEFYRRAESHDSINYRLDSEKTRIAGQFIKLMKRQAKDQRERKEKLLEIRMEKEKEEESKQLEELEAKNLERKSELALKLSELKKEKEAQNKELKEKELIASTFVKKYQESMPFFERKEKEFREKFLKPELVEREEKLKQRRKSYHLSEVLEHSQRYSEQKREERERLSNEKEMQLKSLKTMVKSYFRGSAHELAEKEELLEKEKQQEMFKIKKDRSLRMADYGRKIKEDHMPKIDEAKREEILEILKKEERKNKKMMKRYRSVNDSNSQSLIEETYQERQEINMYEEGNKYMQLSKLRAKRNQETELMQPKTANQILINKESSFHMNEEKKVQEKMVNSKKVWELRTKQVEKIAESQKDIERAKISFQKFDNEAEKMERLLRHSDPEDEKMMEQREALNKFYVCSIKEKIKMLE